MEIGAGANAKQFPDRTAIVCGSEVAILDDESNPLPAGRGRHHLHHHLAREGHAVRQGSGEDPRGVPRRLT